MTRVDARVACLRGFCFRTNLALVTARGLSSSYAGPEEAVNTGELFRSCRIFFMVSLLRETNVGRRRALSCSYPGTMRYGNRDGKMMPSPAKRLIWKRIAPFQTRLISTPFACKRLVR